MKITQNEARNWRKRALAAEKLIEAQKRSWAEEWPNGTHIGSMEMSPELYSAIRTARKLKHAVVACDVDQSNKRVAFAALPIEGAK